MKVVLLAILVALPPNSGAFGQDNNQSRAGWNTYRNAKYGYEIQYPSGFEVRPTGAEGKRDGANIRVAYTEYAAPTPVLDIQVYPKTAKDRFPSLPTELKDLTVTVREMLLTGMPAEEAAYRWRSTGDVAFTEIYLDGVVFHFDASATTQDLHATQWWQIISSFSFRN